MAPTYKTFQDEESLLSQPPKNAWATRKAAGLGAALLLVAVLGVSTVSHVNPMFDIVSAASGGIDFDRSVKTLAPGYDFNLDLDPGCAETDMYGCSHADLAWGDKVAVSAKVSTPGTPLASTGAKIGWSLTAKAGLFPVKIEGECPVCGPLGSTCVVEIPFMENPVMGRLTINVYSTKNTSRLLVGCHTQASGYFWGGNSTDLSFGGPPLSIGPKLP